MILQNTHNDSKHKNAKCASSQFFPLIQKTLTNLNRITNKKRVEELAWESKLVQRASSKVFGYDFLAAMLIASVDAEHATLEKMSDILNSLNHRVRIRPQSIMERLNSEAASCFFRKIFEELLHNQLDSFLAEISPKLLESFNKILIQDSSSLDLNEKLSSFFKGSGGRASKATAKIDVIYDFKAKRYEHIKLTDHGEADQKLALEILDFLIPNTLVIRDLGYLRMDCLKKIDEMKSFFLSRFKNNTCVYLKKEDVEELDLAEYLYRHFKYARVIDIDVFITNLRVPVRFIAYRVPPEVSEQRRRIAHANAKKQGRTLTQKSLNLLDFSLFVTNVPKDIWEPGVVGTIYRLRWQIELLYKSWKTGLKIDYLKGINHHRIKALIYTRMIFVIIINNIYQLLDYIGHCMDRTVSMHKVYNWMRCADRLQRVLEGELGWWEERHLPDLIISSMAMQKRKKRKTSLQAIYECDFYYQEAS